MVARSDGDLSSKMSQYRKVDRSDLVNRMRAFPTSLLRLKSFPSKRSGLTRRRTHTCHPPISKHVPTFSHSVLCASHTRWDFHLHLCKEAARTSVTADQML